jgi:saccharopine dehydrogenase-like NADP-dependent oxidoreductase
MKEKTLRYPGHIQLMAALRESGFFAKEEIEIKGVRISPLEFTSRIMFPKWQLKPGEQEFTVMRVVVEGKETNGKTVRHTYDLLDRFDTKLGVTSMARTTGYACTAAARLVVEGKFARKGICPPEFLGEDQAAFDFLLAYQRERGIEYKHTTETLG